MSNYVKQLEDQLSPESYVVAIRSIANWCNGNLISITGQRIKQRLLEKAPDEVPTIDTAAGEVQDEETRNEHVDEVGHTTGLTLVQRGDCYASIRECCYRIAEEKGWNGQFNKPATFVEYVGFRITRANSQDVTNEMIRQKMSMVMGMTLVDIRETIREGLRKTARKLESSREDLISADSDYVTDIDCEEAIHTLGFMQQMRMRISVINGFGNEARAKAKIILRPDLANSTLVDELAGYRHEMMKAMVKLDEALDTFEERHRDQIEKELAGRPGPQVAPGHASMLRLFKEQVAEELAMRKEILREEMAKKAA